MKKSLTLILTIAIVALFVQCNDQQPAFRTPSVLNHPAVYLVNKTGRITLTATCPKGEQMIGGSYSIPDWKENATHITWVEDNNDPVNAPWGKRKVFDDKATICDKVQGPIYVEASYPSSRNTWTVVIYNPDLDTNCYNSGKYIQVNCYAVTDPGLHLNMRIRSLEPHITNPPSPSARLTDTCNVPDGSVITGGGFKLEPLDDSNPLDWGHLPLWGSYPNMNDQKKAIGWTSEYYTIPPARPCNLTTYVLYSAPAQLYGFKDGVHPPQFSMIPSPLVDGPVKTRDNEKPIGAGTRIGEVVCDPEYFSSGGGFNISYSGQSPYTVIPHSLPIVCHNEPYVNGFQIPFSGWHVELFGAYDVGSTIKDWYSEEFSQVYTLQIKNLRNPIKVVIIEPINGLYLTDDILNNPIKFTGYAVDHDGTYIPGSNLTWTVTSANDGSGEIYQTKLDIAGGDPDPLRDAKKFTVKLTAKGKQGDQASAIIFLYYQKIPNY